MKVAFVEWPEALLPDTPAWTVIARQVAASGAELLVTNELPFGPWIAAGATFDKTMARRSVESHEAGIAALAKLNLPAVLSSRPIWFEEHLLNEAFILSDGQVRPVHQKNYFPEEEGWWEASWFHTVQHGFRAAEVQGLCLGVMLCTDAMFNEHARHYGRQGTSLIAIPRAAGMATENWLTAGKMAAIVSGSYIVSSNRVGTSDQGTIFGGAGFAFGPDGSLLATTDAQRPLLVVEVDPERSRRQRLAYPCYVGQLAGGASHLLHHS
ncbi:carbon-nitrogen hydrolase family protein [Lichenifustis flavocetrariae]|uniref:Carbon-nitrogen hydrolase family protein n=1 Tax=Lichenifustis flavocetrariae TaxID=2949735 RepID=A0AA41Z5T9_9HYPH|nr:carbon-nitrogen hydrolase family protein [Lichenifustis flavocetrariae]MCW6510870.1 carbon-nitrogen hydrolase family protein [Lichenifustis flavocetrariae]